MQLVLWWLIANAPTNSPPASWRMQGWAFPKEIHVTAQGATLCIEAIDVMIKAESLLRNHVSSLQDFVCRILTTQGCTLC
ncbi:MAG: hypothetical protein K9H26_11480 [Prolixibacteraceae bacterium]|nr:hypothetical protein [Prolixibacteraceae bacterium]